jgi:hypothetical protein
MRFTRNMWWAILVVISVATLGLDIATGPYIQFPILFVIPVILAAWHLGQWAGIGFAIVLVAARLVLATTVDAGTVPYLAAVINGLIRLVVLVGLAVAAEALQHRRTLSARVQVLEGILPICSFCKKIRCDDGGWEQIETYVSRHTEAHFSHGLCEACLKRHYPDFADELGTSERPNG